MIKLKNFTVDFINNEIESQWRREDINKLLKKLDNLIDESKEIIGLKKDDILEPDDAVKLLKNIETPKSKNLSSEINVFLNLFYCNTELTQL